MAKPYDPSRPIRPRASVSCRPVSRGVIVNMLGSGPKCPRSFRLSIMLSASYVGREEGSTRFFFASPIDFANRARRTDRNAVADFWSRRMSISFQRGNCDRRERSLTQLIFSSEISGTSIDRCVTLALERSGRSLFNVSVAPRTSEGGLQCDGQAWRSCWECCSSSFRPPAPRTPTHRPPRRRMNGGWRSWSASPAT